VVVGDGEPWSSGGLYRGVRMREVSSTREQDAASGQLARKGEVAGDQGRWLPL